LTVGREVDYCAGDPRPAIRHPQILYQGNDVYIKLKIKGSDRPSKGNLCLGSEMAITRTITLRRDLENVRVYDSGVEPPELRWPSEGLDGMAVAGGGSLHKGDPQMKGREQVRQVHWNTYGAPQGKTIQIISNVGYCAGTERPRIKRVSVRERRHKVFLTAFLTVRSTGNGEGCAGVGYGVRKVVHLRRPLGSRALYDASFSPPKQSWPK